MQFELQDIKLVWILELYPPWKVALSTKNNNYLRPWLIAMIWLITFSNIYFLLNSEICESDISGTVVEKADSD